MLDLNEDISEDVGIDIINKSVGLEMSVLSRQSFILSCSTACDLTRNSHLFLVKLLLTLVD
jgi:hypothetical protein